MRVLITGASGFIGRALVRCLEGRHELRLSQRDTHYDPALSEDCDAVVHLANIAHSSASEDELIRVNADGTRRVAEAAVRNHVRRFVYLSSIKASGEETVGDPVDGSEVPRPTTAYGRSKLAAERELVAIEQRSGLEVIRLRPPLVYGPGVRANFLALFRAIDRGWPLPLAGIENRRSLVYVTNLVEAIHAVLAAPASVAGRAYAVCDGPAISTPHLCLAIAGALGRRARLFRVPVPVPAWLPGFGPLVKSLVADPHPLMEATGWVPSFSLESGLAETARWYRSR